MQNNKWIVGVLGLVVLLILTYFIDGSRFSGNKPVTTEKKTIKIGVIAPLLGPATIFGNAAVKGLELAVEDLANKKNLKYRYELVIEDDEMNPAKSASAAQKLINVDKVQALIVTTSATGQAAKPIAQTAKIPMICIVCTDVTIADGLYTYTNSVMATDEAKAWVDEVARRGMKKVGLISLNNPGVNAAIAAIKAYLPEKGITVAYEERFDNTQRDFKTIIAKAKAANADVYFLRVLSPALEILGQQMKDQGMKSLSAGAGAFVLGTDPKMFEGMWYEDGALVDSTFMTRFKTKYPDVRFNVLAAPYAYDTLMMLVEGFEVKVNIPEYLKNMTSYDGLVGSVTKELGAGSFRSRAAIWEIRDGVATPSSN